MNILRGIAALALSIPFFLFFLLAVGTTAVAGSLFCLILRLLGSSFERAALAFQKLHEAAEERRFPNVPLKAFERSAERR
jgi:hypothetical protein